MTHIDGAITRTGYQRTLKCAIRCSGIGLHSGEKVGMTLLPAEADSGIRFRRKDLGGAIVPALWTAAEETPLCTTLRGENGARVSTVEHLLSAFAGLAIDNAVIEISGPEVPVMDGSAAPFVFLLECAGITEQAVPRRFLKVLKEVTVSEPHRAATILPGEAFSVGFEIDFESPAIARQEWFGHVTESLYKREVARARTFGFLNEVDNLRSNGLAQGGSLENAIVIDGDRIVNEGGLHYPDEFVRHKVLDLIGDLYLAGGPLLGHVHGIKAGHTLTLRLLRTLFADEEAWTWVRADEIAEPEASRAVA
jgi:UDP-3-O-[3-hydroxymyristoyl] N-acetylglucosamine deacetylase